MIYLGHIKCMNGVVTSGSAGLWFWPLLVGLTHVCEVRCDSFIFLNTYSKYTRTQSPFYPHYAATQTKALPERKAVTYSFIFFFLNEVIHFGCFLCSVYLKKFLVVFRIKVIYKHVKSTQTVFISSQCSLWPEFYVIVVHSPVHTCSRGNIVSYTDYTAFMTLKIRSCSKWRGLFQWGKKVFICSNTYRNACNNQIKTNSEFKSGSSVKTTLIRKNWDIKWIIMCLKPPTALH